MHHEKENMEPNTEIMSLKQDQRKAIDFALERDPDPITVYESLINSLLDAPKLESASKDTIVLLLEEATRQFVDSAQYKLDHRYLKLWLYYASLVDNTRVIFDLLMKKGIGEGNAVFYQELATLFELANLPSKAEEMYKLGISRKSHPLVVLKERYAEFQSRVTSKLPPFEVITAILRNSLIYQTRTRLLGKDASFTPWAMSSMSSKEENTLVTSNTQSSKISLDSSHSSGGSTTRTLTEGAAIRQNPLRKHAPFTSKISVPTSSEVGTVASECHFEFDSRLPNGKRHPYAHLLPSTPSSNNAATAAKRPERLMFNLHDLLSPSGVESSFAEVRLRRMGLLDKKWHPIEDQYPRSISPIESVRVDGQEERIAVNFNDRDENHGSNRRFKPPPTRPTFEPTVTLNTKAALEDVFGMFNSPEKTRKLSAAMIREISMPESSVQHSSLTMHVAPGKIEVFQDNELVPVLDENAGISRTPRGTFVPFADETEPSPASVFKPSANLSSRTPFGVARPRTPGSPTGAKGVGEPLKRTNSRESERTSSEPQPESIFSLPQRPEAFRPVSRGARTPSGSSIVSRESHGDVFSVFQPEPEPVSSIKPAVRNRDIPIFGPPPSLRNEIEQPSKLASAFRPFSDEEEEPVFETPGINKGALCVNRRQDKSSLLEAISEPEFADEYEEEIGDENAFRRPQSGRCGQFNVMTPITERTCEFTTSSRALSTPSEHNAVFAVERDAPENIILGKTEMLSLSDSISAVSQFKPSNPCNPFDPEILSTLLSFLPVEKGHFDMKNTMSDHLQTMMKFVSVERKRSSGMGSSRQSSMGQNLLDVLLGNSIFQVVDKLGEGGFGAVFRVREVPDSDEDMEDESPFAALKVVQPRNVWEFYILRDLIRSLPPSLRSSIIEPRALYTFESETVMVLDCEWGTLLELVNKAPQARVAQHGGSGLVEVLAIFFARELLQILEGMHRVGFIHGDMKIDNVLVRLHEDPDTSTNWESRFDPSGHGGWSHKGIRLIDFGRTISTRMFPLRQSFIGDWPTDARDCIELQESRPWTYQTDYFGLAGIFYCMLYGKYLETKIVDGRVQIVSPLKRYWQVDIWSRAFDVLLNSSSVNEDGSLPFPDVLRSVRLEMEDWLIENSTRQQLKGLLKKVAILKDQEQ